jgi:hypothetical protein
MDALQVALEELQAEGYDTSALPQSDGNVTAIPIGMGEPTEPAGIADQALATALQELQAEGYEVPANTSQLMQSMQPSGLDAVLEPQKTSAYQQAYSQPSPMNRPMNGLNDAAARVGQAISPITDMLTFGLGDELQAAERGWQQWVREARPGSFARGYQSALGEQDKASADMWKEHPVLSGAGAVAALPFTPMPGLNLLRSGSVLGRAAKGAALGGGYGSIFGFGAGRGMDQSASSAFDSAKIGAGISGGIPLVAPAMRTAGKIASAVPGVRPVASAIRHPIKTLAGDAEQISDDLLAKLTSQEEKMAAREILADKPAFVGTGAALDIEKAKQAQIAAVEAQNAANATRSVEAAPATVKMLQEQLPFKTPLEKGQRLQTLIQEAKQAEVEVASQLFSKATETGEKIPWNKERGNILDLVKEGWGGLDSAPPEIRRLANRYLLAADGGKTTLAALQRARHEAGQLHKASDGYVRQFGGQVREQIDNAVLRAAENGNLQGETANAWRSAIDHWREKIAEVYQDGEVVKVLDASPSDAWKYATKRAEDIDQLLVAAGPFRVQVRGLAREQELTRLADDLAGRTKAKQEEVINTFLSDRAPVARKLFEKEDIAAIRAAAKELAKEVPVTKFDQSGISAVRPSVAKWINGKLGDPDPASRWLSVLAPRLAFNAAGMTAGVVAGGPVGAVLGLGASEAVKRAVISKQAAVRAEATKRLYSMLSDPNFAKMLTRPATPSAIERATQYIESRAGELTRAVGLTSGPDQDGGPPKSSGQSVYESAIQPKKIAKYITGSPTGLVQLGSRAAPSNSTPEANGGASINKLISAVIQQESGGNPKAVSKAGAMGLMQLMPATAKAYGVSDPFDPEQNLRGGASALLAELERFGSLELALAAYNAGAGKVSAAVQKAGSTDWAEVVKFLPKETQNYVPSVLARM